MSTELIYWIVTLTFLLVIGILMLRYLNSCPHKWNKIESGRIKTRGFLIEEWTESGYYTIHECVHCKKLKRTEI
jgi:hypothetical protein